MSLTPEFTDREIEEFREAFRMFDIDGNGMDTHTIGRSPFFLIVVIYLTPLSISAYDRFY